MKQEPRKGTLGTPRRLNLSRAGPPTLCAPPLPSPASRWPRAVYFESGPTSHNTALKPIRRDAGRFRQPGYLILQYSTNVRLIRDLYPPGDFSYYFSILTLGVVLYDVITFVFTLFGTLCRRRGDKRPDAWNYVASVDSDGVPRLRGD